MRVGAGILGVFAAIPVVLAVVWLPCNLIRIASAPGVHFPQRVSHTRTRRLLQEGNVGEHEPADPNGLPEPNDRAIAVLGAIPGDWDARRAARHRDFRNWPTAPFELQVPWLLRRGVSRRGRAATYLRHASLLI